MIMNKLVHGYDYLLNQLHNQFFIAVKVLSSLFKYYYCYLSIKSMFSILSNIIIIILFKLYNIIYRKLQILG